MGKAIEHTEVLPPTKKYTKKRKMRSDKGVKRTEPKQIKSKVSTQPSKYLFDEVVINGQWWVQIKDNLCAKSLDDSYVLEFMFNGTRYTYRKYFADPTIAYVLGEQFLQYRYKNRTMFQ